MFSSVRKQERYKIGRVCAEENIVCDTFMGEEGGGGVSPSDLVVEEQQPGVVVCWYRGSSKVTFSLQFLQCSGEQNANAGLNLQALHRMGRIRNL